MAFDWNSSTVTTLITAASTLLAVLITQRYNDISNEKRRKEEDRKYLREERKKVYVTMASQISRMIVTGDILKGEDELERTRAEMHILGDDVVAKAASNITTKIYKRAAQKKGYDAEEINQLSTEYYTNLIPLMQEELKKF